MRILFSCLLLPTVLLACAGKDPARISELWRAEIERGHALLSEGRPVDAEDAYRRALAYRPAHPVAQHGLVRSFIGRRDGESALAVLQELREESPAYFDERAQADQALALAQAARQSLDRGDSSRALARVDRLEEVAPLYPGLADLREEAQLAEAGRLYVAGRPKEALSLAARTHGVQPGSAEAAAALAESLIEAEHADAAISVLSDAQGRYPGDARLARAMDRALRIRYPNPFPY